MGLDSASQDLTRSALLLPALYVGLWKLRNVRKALGVITAWLALSPSALGVDPTPGPQAALATPLPSQPSLLSSEILNKVSWTSDLTPLRRVGLPNSPRAPLRQAGAKERQRLARGRSGRGELTGRDQAPDSHRVWVATHGRQGRKTPRGGPSTPECPPARGTHLPTRSHQPPPLPPEPPTAAVT